MATKRIFSINGNSINQFFKGVFHNINSSKFIATSKSGNNILTLPLLLVIVAVIVFPFLLLAGFMLSIIFKINISIEKEVAVESQLIENR